jgi:prepilin-type processing-associated H-X9-DG protein
LDKGEEAMAKIDDEIEKTDEKTEPTPVAGKASIKDYLLAGIALLPTILWHLVCIAGASVLAMVLLGRCLPIWLAAPLGIVLGVGFGVLFAFIAAQIAGSGVTTVLELNVSSGICLVLACILIPVFGQARAKARQTVCASNLKTISGAMLMYAQDYDDQLPLTENWMDSVAAFSPPPSKEASKESVYHCPSIQEGDAVYGYAFNQNVAAKPTAKIKKWYSKMLIYDSTTLTRNASDPGTSLSKIGRHSQGNNIAFVDGHVKWIKNAEDGDQDTPEFTP